MTRKSYRRDPHEGECGSPGLLSEERRSLLMYACFLKLLACSLFFVGFFPLKPYSNHVSTQDDFPIRMKDIPLNITELYKKQYSRMVFMVIDALRYDFVAHGNRMPFLNKKLQDKATSCLLSATTGVPTVTLPRIKAITSGAVPSFLDVIYNFGSAEFKEDNIINQAKKNNLTMVFYGDDTWLRLFPYAFTRSEGTPSFFVNDFYEVDNTVTRNVKEELSRTDWDIMLLHYLGLDHIGHVEGPFGKSIPSKLQEMDDVIKLIMNSMDENTLFVITGDHGMKDSGGHGGSSKEEITVPVVLLNHKCDETFGDHPFYQVDLAPLLSVLLGIPIPAGSTGKVSPKWLAGMSPNSSLYAALYNTFRMINASKTIYKGMEDDIVEAANFMSPYFTSNASSTIEDGLAKRAFANLYKVQSKLASLLMGSNEVNLAFLLPAILIATESIILLFLHERTSILYLYVDVAPTIMSLLPVGITVVLLLPREWGFSLGHPLFVAIILFNLYVLCNSQYTWEILKDADALFLVLCGLLPLTYMSTSFIEEEHMYWYFTFVTLVSWASFQGIKILKELTVVIILQRGLKNLNYTGDKWSGGTDIGDWLKDIDDQNPRMVLMLIGIFLSAFSNWEIGWRRTSREFTDRVLACIDLCLVSLQGFFTLSYQLTANGLGVSKSSGVREVDFFWLATAARITFAVLRVHLTKKDKSSKVLTVITQLHLSMMTLFMEPHNVILLPSLMLFSKILQSAIKNPFQLIILHYWLGECFFFYMGNSNSIATVNVTVGFIGMNEFHLGLAIIYVFLNTYAFPILSYLMLTAHLLDMKSKSKRDSRMFHSMMSSMYLLLNGLPLTIFMVVIFLQREHLFIWTVFSPKLLYMLVHSVLIFALTMSTMYL